MGLDCFVFLDRQGHADSDVDLATGDVKKVSFDNEDDKEVINICAVEGYAIFVS